MQSVDLFARVDRERKMLPSDVAVAMRPGAVLASGEQDEFGLVVAGPRDAVVGVGAGETEGCHHGVELRDAARQVVHGEAEVIEDWHAEQSPLRPRFRRDRSRRLCSGRESCRFERVYPATFAT